MKRKPLSKSIRFDVLNRDNFTCQYCGKSAPEVRLEVDHVKPVSKGGTDHLSNLITTCEECNRGKSNKELTPEIPTIERSNDIAENILSEWTKIDDDTYMIHTPLPAWCMKWIANHYVSAGGYIEELIKDDKYSIVSPVSGD